MDPEDLRGKNRRERWRRVTRSFLQEIEHLWVFQANESSTPRLE
jgi:hypothetical protein